MRRIWLQLKGMGISGIIPLIGYFLAVPGFVFLANKNCSDEELQLFNIVQITTLYFPILTIVWMYGINEEYVEGKGRELLIMNRGIIRNVIIIFLLNLICVWGSLYLIGIDYNDNSKIYVAHFICSFFISGFSFFTIYSFGSIVSSMVVVVCYVIVSNMDLDRVLNPNIMENSMLSTLNYTNMFSDENEMFSFGVLGMILWGIGYIRTRRLYS